MTLADRVTTIRIFLAPVFFVIYNFNHLFSIHIKWYCQIPLLWLIFIVAELSDLFDGLIARKQNQVSDFGKIFDPFADTFMQITLFVCFAWDGIFHVIPLLIVLYREFGILFIRLLMQKKGISMGARMSGKVKTVAYIIAAIAALLVFNLRLLYSLFPDIAVLEQIYSIFSWTAIIIFWTAVLLSVLSFFDYVNVYRQHGNQSSINLPRSTRSYTEENDEVL